MTGIILAGGENRRMGTDKAFLIIDGKTMIEHVLTALRKVCGSIIIVTRSPERYHLPGVLVVRDVLEAGGPLAGIHAGLLGTRDEYNFVAACDMPFISADLIGYMGSRADGYDITVPRIGDLVEPLHAVYRKGLARAIERRLRDGRKDVRGLFPEARVRYIGDEELSRFDPERKSFRNLNTKQEYEEAACSDWGCRNW